MKINNREKVLLIVLGVVVVCILYYKFVFIKQRGTINSLTDEKTKVTATYDEMDSKVKSLSKYETDNKVVNSKIIDKSSKLYPVVMQEKLILEIDKLLKDSKVDGNLSFTEPEAKAIKVRQAEEPKKRETNLNKLANDYNNNKSTENNSKGNTNKANKNEISADQMKTTLTFKGTYDNVYKLLELVNNYEKIVALSNLTIMDSGAGQLAGSIDLEYYAIPKLGDADAEYMKWTLEGNYGKANPFAGGTGKVGKTIEDATKAQNDFVMSLRNVNSDIPSFMLGKANDTNRTTYIYGDSNKTEKVEVTVSKKDGKYYYKYKSEKSSYPLNYKDQGVEFKPVGDRLILKVISTERLDINDSVSAIISVVNETDKNFEVVIENDDRKVPRVKVEGKKGAVTYTNN